MKELYKIIHENIKYTFRPVTNQLWTINKERIKFTRLSDGETNCLAFAVRREDKALQSSILKDLAYKL